MRNHDRSPWMDYAISVGILAQLALVAYIVLQFVLGMFGIVLPVPEWLWEWTS